MSEAYYEILEQSDLRAAQQRARVRSSKFTNGPWSTGLQHAGPPCALLTRAIRRLGGVPEPSVPARLTFEILAPIPIADLILEARVVRPGRKVAMAEATLAAADQPDRPLLLMRAWLLRTLGTSLDLPQSPAEPAPATPMPWRPFERPPGWHDGYLDSIDWHWVSGSFESPGPATVWTRLRVALVADEAPTPIERLVTVADSASGISAVASPERLLFVNTDLTLHLTREPRGSEMWMSAETTLDPAGVGRTIGRLGDAAGMTTSSAQCLFVEPRN